VGLDAAAQTNDGKGSGGERSLWRIGCRVGGRPPGEWLGHGALIRTSRIHDKVLDLGVNEYGGCALFFTLSHCELKFLHRSMLLLEMGYDGKSS
jgi:hypothetical protein